MNHELHYVTTNPGKFTEVSDYLHAAAPQLKLKQFSPDIVEIQTSDQMAIAVDKAKKAWALLKKPLLLDDAAIYFEKYHKFPGTLSKFVSEGLGFEGIHRLIDPDDRAYFLLYMVYIDAPDSMHIFEGRCDGKLIKPDSFSGNPHLPFDVFFIPNGSEITYAEMYKSFDRYATSFYRIKALQKFLSWYQQQSVGSV